MKIQIDKESLLVPLSRIGGIVEKRQTLPILSNFLIEVDIDSQQLKFTATDLEVEMKTSCEANSDQSGCFTIPARKLLDICKALPESSMINLDVSEQKAILKTATSRFSLSILSANDFPSIETNATVHTVKVKESSLKTLIEKTQFCMAQQDVRYYLNGLLLEIEGDNMTGVATDGHRLAKSSYGIIESNVEDKLQAIIPRKAVLELNRLLEHSEDELSILFSANHLTVSKDNTTFTTKLVDGRFPEYQKVIPAHVAFIAKADKGILKSALSRASILSNEKYRGIRFSFANNALELLAHNPEQEESEEHVEIEYDGDEIVIGFNVSYVIDAINACPSEVINLGLNNSNSSCLITDSENDAFCYVIMPMRL